MFIPVLLSCSCMSFVLGRAWRYRQVVKLRDQLHYYAIRDRVGDLSLEGEVRQLRRRLAGLLSSPRMYLRARRLLAPLELPPEELTAELELLDRAVA